jgi:hypothetical protein
MQRQPPKRNRKGKGGESSVAGRGCKRGAQSFFLKGDLIAERDFSRSHKLLFPLYRAILSSSDMRSCPSLKEVQTLSQEWDIPLETWAILLSTEK